MEDILSVLHIFDYCGYAAASMWNGIKGIVRSTYLCIRFPFLYPRNFWTGKHYNSKAASKMNDIFEKWREYSQSHQKEYYKMFGKDCINMFGEPIQVYTNEVLKRSHIHDEYVMGLADLNDRIAYEWYEFVDVMARILHCIPTYSWYDSIPRGWRKRFGIQFCKEMRKAIIHSGGWKYLFTFRITDIKEKYGQFECYDMGATPEVDRVIKKYQYISQYVCIECGDDATKRTVLPAYMSPYCDEHMPKGRFWRHIDNVYGWINNSLEDENRRLEEKDKNFMDGWSV